MTTATKQTLTSLKTGQWLPMGTAYTNLSGEFRGEPSNLAHESPFRATSADGLTGYLTRMSGEEVRVRVWKRQRRVAA